MCFSKLGINCCPPFLLIFMALASFFFVRQEGYPYNAHPPPLTFNDDNDLVALAKPGHFFQKLSDSTRSASGPVNDMFRVGDGSCTWTNIDPKLGL